MPSRDQDFCLETVNGLTVQERLSLNAAVSNPHSIDPVIRHVVGATNGILYRSLIGRLSSYPIPDMKLPEGRGELLLDVGCNWGRWCVTAVKRGYTPVGIDPSLGA